jgi:hypothetical protein
MKLTRKKDVINKTNNNPFFKKSLVTNAVSDWLNWYIKKKVTNKNTTKE